MLCFGSSHFLQARLTSPLTASLCLGYHEVLPARRASLRPDWMPPLLIPVAGEPIRAQLLWLHVHSCSLRANLNCTPHRGTGAVDAGWFCGAFRGQLACGRFNCGSWRTKKKLCVGKTNSYRLESKAQEPPRSILMLNFFRFNQKTVGKYLYDRHGRAA